MMTHLTPRAPETALGLAIVLCFALLVGCARAPGAREDHPSITLSNGLVIDHSATIEPGEYRLAAPGDSANAVVEIRGDDITIDFNGATLIGAADEPTPPNDFTGTAVLIDGGRNITIRNLVARGYKVAVHARNVQNLRLLDCDLSYNYRQRLRSTLQREDLTDWLSYHHNENNEWLRYGAGIYLENCDGAEVARCTVTGGQNGLMLTRCDGGLFWNNNFSFNSGVGLGLYRSSGNRIMHNKLDWNVRGYSHGVYHRGQDSAAILVYEQSSNNTFAYNSATHSGDGFFLWAGQSTMDRGQGGCNDNLIYLNDFSCAPTNGIEVTFSRNRIIGNRIEECWHGIWGGYSYATLIEANRFARNDEAIAIEHGQDNIIRNNHFDADKVAIRLWQNEKQDPNWGYPKHRDTRSRGYVISGNSYRDVRQRYDIRETLDVRMDGDHAADAHPQLLRASTGVLPLRGGIEPWLPPEHPRGRQFILVDEWGPYDFRSPKLWPREKLADGSQRFEVLGPPGRWRVINAGGAADVSPQQGEVPGEVIVTFAPGRVVDLNLRLEYIGGGVVSPFGRRSAPGEVLHFGHTQFIAPVDWQVKWFAWDDATDPRANYEQFKKLLEGEPIKQERTTDLAYTWFRTLGPDLPGDRFATLAEGEIELPPGEYRIEITSDDGVRAWVDGERIIDNWTWHTPTTDTATLRLGGRHRLRVEHFEIDGFATLQLRIVPVRAE